MGGYGHSRLREFLLGGATYELLHKAPGASLARALKAHQQRCGVHRLQARGHRAFSQAIGDEVRSLTTELMKDALT